MPAIQIKIFFFLILLLFFPTGIASAVLYSWLLLLFFFWVSKIYNCTSFTNFSLRMEKKYLENFFFYRYNVISSFWGLLINAQFQFMPAVSSVRTLHEQRCVTSAGLLKKIWKIKINYLFGFIFCRILLVLGFTRKSWHGRGWYSRKEK